MEYWEFLIQQEGDQTWLPLETKQVEILEGRYRVAAHTSRANTPVEIRVSHLILDEIPPRRRVRKRKGVTNDSGLLVIFPYINLKPGRWEIRCSGDDVLEDLLGAGWQEGVQLQVMPRDDDWEPDWSAGPEALNSESANVDIESTGTLDKSLQLASQPVLTHQTHDSELVKTNALASSHAPEATTDAFARSEADALSQKIVDEMFQSVDQVLTSSTNPIASAQAHLTEATADSDYRLRLEKQSYVSPLGQPLALKGQIFRKVGTSLAETQLSVQLRDPETAQILFETRQYLAPQPIPAHFELNVPLPAHLQTRVILGAVALRENHNGASADVLASSAFTITAGLDQLLDAIANQDSTSFEEEVVYPGTTEPFVAPEESPETLIAPDLPLSEIPVQSTAPSEGMTLPPQIYQPSDTDDRKQVSPKLPTLPAKPAPAPIASTEQLSEDGVEGAEISVKSTLSDAAGEQADLQSPAFLPVDASDASLGFQGPALFTDDDSVEDDDLEAALAVAALEEDYELDDRDDSPAGVFDRGIAENYQSEGSDDDVSEAYPSEDEPQEDEFDEQITDADEPIDPVFVQLDQSFQSLNTQERFWDRLTALTFDGYNAASELKDAMDAAGVTDPSRTQNFPDETVMPASESSPVPEADETPAVASSVPPNREVVVYDDPTPDESDNATILSSTTVNSHKKVGQFAPKNLSARRYRSYEEPVEIASPTLEVPAHDLTAGELVPIIIRLPRPSDYRPYVKVWMNDLQTRTVIDDPRLLMHFTPNQQGELETLMRIKVPLGCLEIQFAAIVINMATLQESAKVVVNRHVLPPELPSISLDDI